MSLRSQLALSHLKVLLAFVLIHLILFIAATQMSNTSKSSDAGHFEELRARAPAAQSLPELLSLVESYAREENLVIVVESQDGEPQIFGERESGRQRRPGPREILWQGDDQELAAVRLQGLGRPRPPANPVVHVLITTLLAGVFGVLLAFRFSKAVSSPLADLVRATQHLEAGREGTSQLVGLKGPQEIQNLGRSFARMSETLSANLRNLREERNRAEASEASRRQLIADVSHNLRTPLTAAIGRVDSLIDGHVEDQESCLRQVRRETLWASQRLERLLRLSRWEHSEPMMTQRKLSLSETVLEVAENLEERAREVRLTLELNIEPGIEVRADRHHLRDLIQILLENVIEHSGEDCQASVHAHSQDGQVRVVIQDNGTGFDPEFLQSWAGEPLVAKTGRVSLGLAIARRLAGAHGSELLLSNREDQSGSEASFRLAGLSVE